MTITFRKKNRFYTIAYLACALAAPSVALAQAQIGPADASRVDERVRTPEIPKQIVPPAPVTPKKDVWNAPAGSEKIRFVLKRIELQGEGADPAIAEPAYEEFLGKEITLDTAWLIASRIGERYQAEGYFLTRVFVPQQEIGDGTLRLKIVEGFISEISLDETARKNGAVSEWSQRLLNKKPLRLTEVENVLLRINSLPGFTYRTILELPQEKNPPEGAVRLSIVSAREAPNAQVSLDNYGSRFLGPFEISQRLQMALIPNQLTTISVLTATQIDELRYGGIAHEIPLGFNWNMDLAGSITAARPGYTLKSQEITSTSKNYGVGLTYHWLRQREQTLSTRFALEARDTESKILSTTPLTDDFIRAFRMSASYQGQGWGNGYHQLGATLSRGLPILGASKARDLNLSRAEAKPNFTKLEMSAVRVQSLPQEFYAIGRVGGQLASAPLYSSEEFGFGGQNFGRAYDSSEITGDHGVAASIELRYSGLPAWYGANFLPYGFYDIGKVWNKDTGQSKPQSASSSGFGIRTSMANGFSANLGAAFPLTRNIATPLDGHSQGPRYLFQITQDF